MLLNAPLEGIAAKGDKQPGPRKPKRGKAKEMEKTVTATTTTPAMAEELLERYPTAKIVVVIDTHCLDNGYFVYTGNSPETYKACSLKEAGISCTMRYTISHLLTVPSGLHPGGDSEVPP